MDQGGKTVIGIILLAENFDIGYLIMASLEIKQMENLLYYSCGCSVWLELTLWAHGFQEEEKFEIRILERDFCRILLAKVVMDLANIQEKEK